MSRKSGVRRQPSREILTDVTVVGRTHAGPVPHDAVLLIDKPQGWTSFDVVRHLRKRTGVRKVGHAGTLDPMATGLLVCMIGRATKQMRWLVEMDKEYEGTVRLGQTTPSYDADTPVDRERDASEILLEHVHEATREFVGDIVQQTPAYSAVRIGGEPLYRKARRGEVSLGPPRIVSIHEFQTRGLHGSDLDFEVRCSTGTYVRSLAHELGERLGVGGHLTRLRRTAVGCYRVEEALTIAELDRLIGGNETLSVGEGGTE